MNKNKLALNLSKTSIQLLKKGSKKTWSVLGSVDPSSKNLEKDLVSLRNQAVALSTDVTNSDQCKALADKVMTEFGCIDGLINSAYDHGEWATTDLADPEGWQQPYNVNWLGALRMAQACLPSMKNN